MIHGLVLLLAAAAEFSGTWIVKLDGRNFLVLTLSPNGGTMVRPARFTMDSDGDISNISAEQKRCAVHWTKRGGEFRAGDDLYRIRLVDGSHATLEPADASGMRMRLERARPGDDLALGQSWPEPQSPPEITALQKLLKAMVDDDQAARLQQPISVSRVEEMDRRHHAELERIFEQYGWPKRSLVGKEAGHNYWLLVQHQDRDPALQRKVLAAMERAVREGEASKSDYAYLYDRVRVGQGKPQHWGTQASCRGGQPRLQPVDDPEGLEQRRRDLGLPPVREYLKQLRRLCAQSR